MNYKKYYSWLVVTVFSLLVTPVFAQELPGRKMPFVYPYSARVYDSLAALRIPLVEVPASRLKTLLPESVDNSTKDCFPGLQDQFQFYSCQQYAGVAYTFGYEFNRLKGTIGWYWENRFPAHYTWNFYNDGERYCGVNFLHSFDLISQQGHMTNKDFGEDTSGSNLGWKSGYNKYFSGMPYRLKNVRAIPINSIDGINTLRNYLYDHLDGSPIGGIACFTTDSWFEMGILPPGTPEAGKNVQLWWHPTPDHGLCIVGYNDSIRYDVNGDGQFTNNLDINSDGIVDARDWEIGGFKFANSWGYWWCDNGFAYVLYSAMASNYEEGGVWNNRVYIVEADTGYHPQLTTKVTIDYNKRQRIRLIAGVSSNPAAQAPEHTMTFPIINFQGGDHVMNGFDYDPAPKSIEVGLDVTPLLNWFPENGQAKLFLGIEERDPDHTGSGVIQQASFIRYIEGEQEFVVTNTPVAIQDNDLTLISTMVTANASKVKITTPELPPLIPSAPYQVQLQATGGTTPYSWTLQENYVRQPYEATIPANTGTKLTKISDLQPYAAKALPFSFPWYGTLHDSIYINFYGFVSFVPQAIPAPYITDEPGMMKMFPVMCPALSQFYTYIQSKNDGVFYQAFDDKVIIWWKTSVQGHENNSNNNFAVVLYPDGKFEFLYGNMNTGPVLPTIYTGISKGDMQDFDVEAQWGADTLAGKALRYLASPSPQGISLSPDGLLQVTSADSTVVYSIPVVVTDELKMKDRKLLQLAAGLKMTEKVICDGDSLLKAGVPAQLRLTLVNTGSTPLPDLTIRLRSHESGCIVTDSVVAAGPLNPNVPVIIEPAFNFMLTQPLPDQYPVRLQLVAQSGERSWSQLLDVPVSAALDQPWVVFNAAEVHDANGRLETGETAPLNITLANIGNQPASNVMASLSCTSPYITLVDSTAWFGNFTTGGLVTIGDAFTIAASMDIPNGIDIVFTLSATDGTLTWTSQFALKPYAPAFTIGAMQVADANGNGDGILDPGETAELLISTTNSGGYFASGTTATLLCDNPYLTINQGSDELGELAQGETVNAQFNVTVAPDAPLNTPVALLYQVESGLYQAQKSFNPKIGQMIEDFESGDFSQFPWTFSGNANWQITNDQPFEGLYSSRSGTVTDNQTTAMLLQREVNSADSLSFYLKTSSEADYDYLRFYIDGNLKGQWSGETPWSRVAYAVTTGIHTFRWEYSKDVYTTGGSDCSQVDYIVLPNTAPLGVNVTGTVTYANTVATPLGGLTVHLKDDAGVVLHTTSTSASGGYVFNLIQPGNYTVAASTVKPWNGVTAADMLLFRKHIANISYLNGIHLACGDVNLSGTLTAADVLLIQKRIAHITQSFPSGDWLFNPGAFTVGNTPVVVDFNGITYGDANGSYIPAGIKAVPPVKGIIFAGDATAVQREVVVPVIGTAMEDLGAFQFTLHYDPASLVLCDITDWLPVLGEVTIGMPEPGKLTFVWSAPVKGISLQGEPLCKLHFRSLTDAPSTISFGDDPTPVEFASYEGDLFLPEMKSGTVQPGKGSVERTRELILYPNPSGGVIYLWYPTMAQLSVRVTDPSGVVVFEKKNLSTDGSQLVKLNLEGLKDGLYTVTTNDGVQMMTRKIIITH